MKDAELHAEEDKNKKALAEARNSADALIYATEKTLRELGEKIRITSYNVCYTKLLRQAFWQECRKSFLPVI